MLEIFVKEGDKYKRISQCGTKKDDEPTWKLEYQDGCHYEPLIECLMQGNDKKKVWKKQEDDMQQAANAEHEPCKSADEDEEESQVKIVLGNISSWKLHNDEAFAVMQKTEADVAVLVETRIKYEVRSAHIQSAANGCNVLLSNPRPEKINIGGPKEGGVAIIGKNAYTLPDIGRAAAIVQLDPNFAIHTVIPIWCGGKESLLHIIGAYCSKDQDEQIKHIFQYAASLGDVPIVIAADWNNLSDKNRELVCAKLTGDWVEALEHLVETTDDIKASKDLEKKHNSQWRPSGKQS